MNVAALPAYLRDIHLGPLESLIADVSVKSYVDAYARNRKIYAMGDEARATIILLPPYGVSFLLLLRLASNLAQKYYVLISESFGCPDHNVMMRDEDFMLDSQARDVGAILKHEQIERYHIVGWCQAAQVIAQAIAVEGIKPTGVTWIAPSGFGYSVIKPEFERCALPIYLEIHRSGLTAAQKLSVILDKYRDDPGVGALTGERLTMLHLAHPHLTLVFAGYMNAFETNKAVAQTMVDRALVDVPTQLIHCRDDSYSHYSESVEIARARAHVELLLFDTGGHLQVFDEPEAVADRVMQFVQRQQVTLCEER